MTLIPSSSPSAIFLMNSKEHFPRSIKKKHIQQNLTFSTIFCWTDNNNNNNKNEEKLFNLSPKFIFPSPIQYRIILFVVYFIVTKTFEANNAQRDNEYALDWATYFNNFFGYFFLRALARYKI